MATEPVDEAIGYRAVRDSISEKSAQLAALNVDKDGRIKGPPPPTTAADDLADLEARRDAATDPEVRDHFARMIATATAPAPVSYGSGDGGARQNQPQSGTLAEQIRAAERAGDFATSMALKASGLQMLHDPATNTKDLRF